MNNDKIYLGTIVEESGDNFFGIIKDNHSENEFYVRSTGYKSKDSKVIFQLKRIGPNNKITRATNNITFNDSLQLFEYAHKNYFKDPNCKYKKEEFLFLTEGINLFLENGINENNSELSFRAKKGLELYKEFKNLNSGVINDQQ